MLRSRIERARNRPARIPSEIQIPGVTQHQEVEIPIDIAPVDDKSLKDGVILLVDDTPDNLRLLADLLKNKYKIKLANNGQKALDICRSESPPDLVLLDIMMPGISGYEVLKELRSQSNTEHIPVMFVTAMNEADSELKGMELGAIDYITKPINPHLLQLRVRNMMMQVQRIWEAQSSVDDMIALAEARNEAEQMVRHDLKGPLSGIIASIQQIALQPRNLDVITEHSNGIDFLAHQLLNMINLSAELYKIEQGIYQLDATEIDTAKLLKDVITVCDNSFAAKRLTCNLIVPSGSSDKSLFSLGDPLLLYSVFFNLVKNAFEAAPEKSAVRASISRDDKTIKIILSNDGSVPQNIRSKFFEKYATSGKEGGTGIGTYSAQLLVKAQNGSLELEVDDDANSTTLIIVLPAA
nr:response regulator [Echinimonas agarilytica]